MGHIDVNGVSFGLPDGRPLLRDVHLRVGEGAKVALIGPNGTGKTTLTRIVAGDLTPDEGAVTRSGGLAVMRQFIGHVRDDSTVRDLLLSVAPDPVRLAASAIDAAELRMMERDSEADQMAYAQALSDWADVGGYDWETHADVCTVAALGMPFEKAQWRKVATLSGGEQKRVVLESLLRLLHPLVPFVTEELWRQVASRLGVEGDSISLQPYPQPEDFAGQDYAGAEADIEWFKAMVSALRRVRSELGVSPGKAVRLLLAGGAAQDRERVDRFASQLGFLLRLEAIEWLHADAEPPAAAAAIVGELKLLVPLEGLVDLDAERARLDKELARVSAEKDKSEAKLEKFTDKVPAAVVEQERQRLADWGNQLSGLQAQRAKLG